MRTAGNLFVTWFAVSLWHGVSWGHMRWGMYCFLILMGERYAWGGVLEKSPKALRHVYLLLTVFAGWVLFAFGDRGSLGAFIRALCGRAAGGWVNAGILYGLSSRGLLLLLGAIGATPFAASVYAWLAAKWPVGAAAGKPVLVLAGLILSVAYLVDAGSSPFLYVRF